jgi:hypothetical protein
LKRQTSIGFVAVNCQVTAVVTRFRLRSSLWLPLFFLAFRRVYKEARLKIPGLIEAAFLIQAPRTCYVFSMWTDENAIIQFGTKILAHISAGNWSMQHIFRRDQTTAPEIWSVQWALRGTSSNLNWEGVDLQAVIAKQARQSYPSATDEVTQ